VKKILIFSILIFLCNASHAGGFILGAIVGAIIANESQDKSTPQSRAPSPDIRTYSSARREIPVVCSSPTEDATSCFVECTTNANGPYGGLPACIGGLQKDISKLNGYYGRDWWFQRVPLPRFVCNALWYSRNIDCSKYFIKQIDITFYNGSVRSLIVEMLPVDGH
jgi:hypothetical protein